MIPLREDRIDLIHNRITNLQPVIDTINAIVSQVGIVPTKLLAVPIFVNTDCLGKQVTIGQWEVLETDAAEILTEATITYCVDDMQTFTATRRIVIGKVWNAVADWRHIDIDGQWGVRIFDQYMFVIAAFFVTTESLVELKRHAEIGTPPQWVSNHLAST